MSRVSTIVITTWFLTMITGALAAETSDASAVVSAAPIIDFSGTVRDQVARPLKAALVNANNVNTNVMTTAITDADGRFTVPHLNAGLYEITVHKEGYGTITEKRSLPVKGSFGVALRDLNIVPLEQMRDVDVIRYMPDDDPARTALGGGGGVMVPVAGQSEKTLVRDRCVRCHSLGLVFQAKHSKPEWEQVVSLMETFPTGASHPAGYSLTGNPEVKPRLIDYLAKYLSPESQLPQKMERQVKDGYREEVPLGSGVVFTEWKLPTAIAMGHTAVPDNRGHVFITEWGVGKIARFDLRTQEFVEYPVKTAGGNPHGINVGPDGIVWYTKTSDGNLGRLDPQTGTVEEFTPPKDQPGGLNVIIARNGIVWYATNGGLGRFDPVTKQFSHLVVEDGMASPYALFQSKQNDDVIWFCVEGQNRVGFVNVKTREAKVLHTTLPGPKRPRIDSAGRVWFGYYEGGALGMIDPVTMKLTDFPLPYRGSAYAIHVDGEDNVWVASYERSSLIRLDAKTHALTEYPWPTTGGIVRDIWPDAQGNMWYVHFAWTHNVLVRAERPHNPAASGLQATN